MHPCLKVRGVPVGDVTPKQLSVSLEFCARLTRSGWCGRNEVCVGSFLTSRAVCGRYGLRNPSLKGHTCHVSIYAEDGSDYFGWQGLLRKAIVLLQLLHTDAPISLQTKCDYPATYTFQSRNLMIQLFFVFRYRCNKWPRAEK